jgi:hypothetical protein
MLEAAGYVLQVLEADYMQGFSLPKQFLCTLSKFGVQCLRLSLV